jgi:hypothetical protein
MKIQICRNGNEHPITTVSLYDIQFLHTRPVHNCTIFLGLGVKTLHYQKRYLAK